MTTKVCSKCGVEKEVGEFGRDKSGKDGLRSYCKDCVSAKNKAWNATHQEVRKARDRAWYVANQEAARAKVKAWRGANPEAVKARSKAYAEALSDSYVAGMLKPLGIEPTPETITLKRTQLKIIRKIKEIEQLTKKDQK